MALSIAMNGFQDDDSYERHQRTLKATMMTVMTGLTRITWRHLIYSDDDDSDWHIEGFDLNLIRFNF